MSHQRPVWPPTFDLSSIPGVLGLQGKHHHTWLLELLFVNV
jgi:hypothetical protein